jgi:hypothetical protein
MIVEQSVECELAGEAELLGENLLQCHFSTANLTWPDPSLKPDCRGGKPAANRLSYGAAKCRVSVWEKIATKVTSLSRVAVMQ